MVKNPLQYLCSMPQCCHTHTKTSHQPLCLLPSVWTDGPRLGGATERRNAQPTRRRSCLPDTGSYKRDVSCEFMTPSPSRWRLVGVSLALAHIRHIVYVCVGIQGAATSFTWDFYTGNILTDDLFEK